MLSAETIFETLDATWPAAKTTTHAGWRLRAGNGGGKRVSAARALKPDANIQDAEDAMVQMGQNPLFMLGPQDDAFDHALAERGYAIVDPVTIYAAPTALLAHSTPPTGAIEAFPPLAIQAEIWSDGGIGPARLAIMERATCARTTILGRLGDRPAATVYVALSGEVAMLHALETRPRFRRQGVGRRLVEASARWTVRHGGSWLTLAVVTDNLPANALYRSLGMEPVTTYHYRKAPEAT